MSDTITCPRCGMTSAHPMDLAEGYCGNCHDWTRDDRVMFLRQYTIYDHPLDCPESWVVREWQIKRGSAEPVPGPAWTAPTLQAARGLIPTGLFCLPREADDDPVIVETWT